MAFEDQRTTVYKVDPAHPESETLPTLRTEELLLNMGPQHPSTHGVLKVILELEGERLVKSTPVMGFLHRGVEKLAERLMNITVPDRAEYLRTIVAEVQRIIGHQFWLGTQALDIGAMTVFFYCFRDREILLDWFDELCGARLTTSWYRIGGVERDFTPALFAKLKQFLEYFPSKIDEYVIFLEKNRIWIARTKGVAVISAEDAVNFGLSGPTLRGSGVDYDLRKAEPYSAYPKCEFSVPLGKNGDTYDRYWIRVMELYESVKIIKQCLEQIQDGPIMADVPSVTLPPKERVFTNLESMIQQFKLFSQGFDAPPGEIYCGTEAHKGELGFFIVSTGGGKPYRLKIRAPSFIHMGAFDHMSRGYMIADAITLFGTYDIVMGECDR
jgi:NADH:ubiquinone oxidoreductase subunit D